MNRANSHEHAGGHHGEARKEGVNMLETRSAMAQSTTDKPDIPQTTEVIQDGTVPTIWSQANLNNAERTTNVWDQTSINYYSEWPKITTMGWNNISIRAEQVSIWKLPF